MKRVFTWINSSKSENVKGFAEAVSQRMQDIPTQVDAAIAKLAEKDPGSAEALGEEFRSIVLMHGNSSTEDHPLSIFTRFSAVQVAIGSVKDMLKLSKWARRGLTLLDELLALLKPPQV